METRGSPPRHTHWQLSQRIVNKPAQSHYIVISCWSIVLLISGVIGVDEMAAFKNPTQVENLCKSSINFALDLYKQCSLGKEENLFISPFSISTALAMTFAGTRGETSAQMRLVMKFADVGNDSSVHDAFEELLAHLHVDKPGITLSTANRMYVQQQMTVLSEFESLLRDKYNSTASNVDFQADHDAIRLEINQWVEGQTNSKIKDLIAEGILNSLTRMVLVNAIYFKGDWEQKFDVANTSDREFQVTSGKTVMTKFMAQNGKFKSAQSSDLNCRALELPYLGKNLSMIVLLPNELDGLTGMLDKLDADTLSTILKDMHEDKLDVILPKFKLESHLSLVPTLSTMGISDLFSDNADLSGITGNKDLQVSAVIHKAFLEVNEEGSEAAAATGVVMMLRCLRVGPPPFLADHPFLVLIRDNVSGAILFIGQLVTPEATSEAKDEF